MIANGQTFKKTVIFLDGSSFINCTFDDCELIYSGLMPVSLNGNTMKDCRWQFTGPAQNSMGFLTMLYASGARDLIEATFTAIRNGSIINPPTQPVAPEQQSPAPQPASS
jgi:hypothetical protein